MVDNHLTASLKKLLVDGYSKEDIIKAASAAAKEVEQSESKDLNVLSKRLTMSQILLFIGGIVTVLGGIFFVGINWESWNSFLRILAILIPYFAVLGTAIVLKNTNQNAHVANVFAVTSSLLFPLFLLVFFAETELISNLEDPLQGLIYSGLSTICFGLMALYFRSVVWGILYTSSIFVSYFFVREYSQISIVGPNTIYWGALILGLLFIGYCYGLYKKGLNEYARYPYLVTLGVSVFCLVMMLFNHPLESLATWYLFLPFGFYLIIASFLERDSTEELAKGLYFLGVLSLFLMLTKLSLAGNLFNIVGFERTNTSYFYFPFRENGAIGGSFAISGLVFLGLNYLANYIKRYGLSILSGFSAFFELVGVWFLLGGIFYAGLGEHRILVELLLGFLSILAIYVSTIFQSRIYLYLGTIFLVIFIFAFGGEYFSNSVGWPVTLFFSGIISMGVGFLMGKLQKQFD